MCEPAHTDDSGACVVLSARGNVVEYVYQSLYPISNSAQLPLHLDISYDLAQSNLSQFQMQEVCRSIEFEYTVVGTETFSWMALLDVWLYSNTHA